MKNLLIILTVFFFITVVQGQTNVFHSFSDSSIWRVDATDFNPQDGGCTAHYYFQYYVSGDTIINSHIHKKIIRSSVYFTKDPPDSNDGFIMLDSGYVGALLDDSILNKTFFVFNNTTTDSLLFDYNLNIGDTFHVNHNGTFWNYVVESIDSVIIDSHERKRWNFFNGFYYIQGIGSKMGLFEHIDFIGPDFYLICVKENTNILFVSDTYSDFGCNLITSNHNEINYKHNITFYPNPFSSQTTFMTDNFFKNVTLKIYNSFGQIVKQINNIYGQTFTLQRENLLNGIYFLQLIQNDRIFTTDKLVITDK